MALACAMFPFSNADGPANMALDEALLESTAAAGDFAALRTYGWSVPTLSLGYFQHLAEMADDPRWRAVPRVRRPTGGGAIWHHHELTYALVLPAAHPLARPNVALYRAVHSAIADLLRGHGVEASRRGAGTASHAGGRPFLCFTDCDPEDLVCLGVKIVGSAQRRRAGAILQHGSMLLKRSPITPELGGAGDLGSATSDPRYWSEVLSKGLPQALGLVPQEEDFPATLRQAADALEREVYRNHAWNRRR